MAEQSLSKQSRFVLRFFVVAVSLFSLAGGVASVLIRLWGPASVTAVFAVSTTLLITCSVALQNAQFQVKRERQQPFRRSLIVAMTAGTLFLAIQSLGLWSLLKVQNPSEAQTGAQIFVLVFAVLHGLHLCVALMFLIYVSLKAFADRYDHEFYWGVTVCAFFWHLLGLVWLLILAVFAISKLT
ncbi:MAG: cytochrome c oxidase subunit 3 [Planctomycetes bacterium]|nr:cytochrome c oxidase subunit 3 [Planctomycetota bacterium]